MTCFILTTGRIFKLSSITRTAASIKLLTRNSKFQLNMARESISKYLRMTSMEVMLILKIGSRKTYKLNGFDNLADR
jgi:hypothetical protein